jgi:hypothetical protein
MPGMVAKTASLLADQQYSAFDRFFVPVHIGK